MIKNKKMHHRVKNCKSCNSNDGHVNIYCNIFCAIICDESKPYNLLHEMNLRLQLQKSE